MMPSLILGKFLLRLWVDELDAFVEVDIFFNFAVLYLLYSLWNTTQRIWTLSCCVCFVCEWSWCWSCIILEGKCRCNATVSNYGQWAVPVHQLSAHKGSCAGTVQPTNLVGHAYIFFNWARHGPRHEPTRGVLVPCPKKAHQLFFFSVLKKAHVPSVLYSSPCA